jgi:hypothetical protein
MSLEDFIVDEREIKRRLNEPIPSYFHIRLQEALKRRKVIRNKDIIEGMMKWLEKMAKSDDPQFVGSKLGENTVFDLIVYFKRLIEEN